MKSNTERALKLLPFAPKHHKNLHKEESELVLLVLGTLKAAGLTLNQKFHEAAKLF